MYLYIVCYYVYMYVIWLFINRETDRQRDRNTFARQSWVLAHEKEHYTLQLKSNAIFIFFRRPHSQKFKRSNLLWFHPWKMFHRRAVCFSPLFNALSLAISTPRWRGLARLFKSGQRRHWAFLLWCVRELRAKYKTWTNWGCDIPVSLQRHKSSWLQISSPA